MNDAEEQLIVCDQENEVRINDLSANNKLLSQILSNFEQELVNLEMEKSKLKNEIEIYKSDLIKSDQ